MVVFDALGTPVLGAELLAEIRKRTRLPVRRVIVSHYHADHFYGLAAFKAAGAEIWAHRSARAYLESQAAKDRLAERSRSLAPWVPADMALEAPSRWLDGEQSFKLGVSRSASCRSGRRTRRRTWRFSSRRSRCSSPAT